MASDIESRITAGTIWSALFSFFSFDQTDSSLYSPSIDSLALSSMTDRIYSPALLTSALCNNNSIARAERERLLGEKTVKTEPLMLIER